MLDAGATEPINVLKYDDFSEGPKTRLKVPVKVLKNEVFSLKLDAKANEPPSNLKIDARST